MTGKSPAYQFYPDKWLSHTGHLTHTAYAIYHRMLCWAWLHGETQYSVPSDPETIGLLLGEPCARIKAALDEIQNPHMPLFKVEDGFFVSNGLRKEFSKQSIRRGQTRKAAKTRWRNEKQTHANAMQTHTPRICVPDANASSTQCPPSPSPSPSPSPIPPTDISLRSISCPNPEIPEAETESPEPDGKPDKAAVLAWWNDEMCPGFSIPTIRAMSGDRWEKFRIREKEGMWEQRGEIVEQAHTSEFILSGAWFGYDWLVKNATNWRKVVEKNYRAVVCTPVGREPKKGYAHATTPDF